jgi:protein-L-isoaspartate O-methyltransferase
MIEKIDIRLEPAARAVYESFSIKKHAEHIATPISLQALFLVLQKVKPRRVLEIGGGIGTLSALVLKNSEASIDIFENIPLCIEALQENLQEFKGRFQLLTSYENSPLPSVAYDLVIVDGGTNSLITQVFRELRSVTAVYVDGHRDAQRALIRRELMKAYVYHTVRFRDPERKHKGGSAIYSTKNKNAFARVIYHIREEFLARQDRHEVK